jgi:N-hydroxyarylamine O-acetyltransferase
MDLTAYFQRIGTTSREPAALLAAHIRAIPFENFDVLLGRPPRLDLESLEAKLVRARRGGYCYEHATLFAAVLRELGVTVKTHSARVVMMTPREQSPRTHMFLTVGDDVYDPGFGGQAPLVPVPIGGSAGVHRVVREEGGGIALEMEQAGGWQRLWVSTLEHDHPIDFVMANHFTATHPSSPFTQRIMARALFDGGKATLMNRDATIVRGGDTKTWSLASGRELRAFVAEYWGFDLPELETLTRG